MSRAPTAAVVVDTHTLLWSLFNLARLSSPALAALRAAEAAGEPIYVPSITVVELRYLVEKGKYTEGDYATIITTLKDATTAPTVVMLDLDIADALSSIPRATVPDMPDRIIAATALHLGLPLVTRDTDIRASSVTTIW